MIDIHNHFLPAIDDGPETLAEALELAHLAVADGITHLLCTPHIHPGRYDNNRASIEASFIPYKEAVAAAGIELKLAMAAEIRISDLIIGQVSQGQLPICGHWQERPVLLLEMPHECIPVGIEALLRWLQQQGYQPLIAHPERNKAIMRNPRLAQDLARTGALFQLTAGSVAGQFGRPAQQTAHWLLDQQLVQFVASDAHGRKRLPAMQAAYKELSATYGDELAERLTRTNPAQLTTSLFAEVSS